MKTSKIREIERLVSEMSDDGLDGDSVHRLDELLTDDPAAQKHYWQLVDTHVALCVAISSNSAQTGSTRKRSTTSAPAGTASRAAVPLRRHPWWLAIAAAVLVIGCVSLLRWTLGTADVGLAPLAIQPPSHGMTQMPMITQVSWEGPSFASSADQWQPVTMVSAGAITLRVKEGEVADGYAFCLMPGESVKLLATFDATGENSLSVVEISGSKPAAMKKVSFHNSGAGPKPLHANPNARNRRYGVLGHWSETNTTDQPRYFLLTGVHKLARPTPQESWRLSKIAVLVEDASVVHIGWDDSGPAPAEGQAYHEDYDYDDLAASLFFDRRSPDAIVTENGIRVFASRQQPTAALPAMLERGYDFELAPGDAAVIKAASEASDPNLIAVIDLDTQEVLWSSSSQLTRSTNLGAACVTNPSSQVKRIRLVGIHRPHDSSGPGVPWRVSQYETLYEQPGFFIVGFEDSFGDKDFDDVRASVLVTHVP